MNRFIIHRYAMQPWMDRLPGMTFGPHGIHVERTQTWWKPGAAWFTYLARHGETLRTMKIIARLYPTGSLLGGNDLH